MVPIAMTLNSAFLRYRSGSNDGSPSQRFLGVRTAGHAPYLFSHTVTVRAGDVVFSEIEGRWNDTPFWVFQVPVEVSADHGDISSPVLGRLMMQLLELNEVFDPDLELRIAPAPVAAGS